MIEQKLNLELIEISKEFEKLLIEMQNNIKL